MTTFEALGLLAFLMSGGGAVYDGDGNPLTISSIQGLVAALAEKYELPDGGIENDLSDDVKEMLAKAGTIDFTLKGKSVSYRPTEEPTITTEFTISQEGEGLASPTNIREITALSGLSLIINNGSPITVDFNTQIGAGEYNWNSGKLHKTYHVKRFTGQENIGLFHASTSNGRTTIEWEIDAGGAPYGAPSGNSYCSHFATARGGYAHGYNFCGLGAGDGSTQNKARRYIFAYNGTPADFVAYLQTQNAAGTPVTIVYEMVAPAEIDFAPAEIPYAEGVNTANGSGIITVNGKMLIEAILGSDETIGSYGFLKGKTAVFFGDSLVGNYKPPYDYPSYVAKYTGLNVINAGFGGCRMAYVNETNDSTRPALSMVSLAEAISTDDWSGIDGRLSVYPDSYNIDYWGTEENYVPEKIAILKNIDWENIDYVVIGYGTNDFTSAVSVEDNNSHNHGTLKGAMRSSIEYLLGKYSHLKIMLVSPPWRWWDENTEDNPSGINGFTSSDNYKNANGDTLVDFVNAIGEVASEYHLPFLDLYHACSWNEQNRYNYFSFYDGTHPNQYTDGFPMMARLVSGFLRAPEGYAQISMKIADTGNYFTSDTFEGALQEIGAELAGINALVGGDIA